MRHDSRATTLLLDDEKGTEALGAALAALLRPGDFVALSGPLGAGKTALARATILEWLRAEGLAAEDVPSPTFTLVQTYAGRAFDLWHADLYRLGGPREADELGLLDEGAEIAALVEWPDRLGDELPADRLEVELSVPADAGTAARRAVALRGTESWVGRIEALASRACRDPRVRQV